VLVEAGVIRRQGFNASEAGLSGHFLFSRKMSRGRARRDGTCWSLGLAVVVSRTKGAADALEDSWRILRCSVTGMLTYSQKRERHIVIHVDTATLLNAYAAVAEPASYNRRKEMTTTRSPAAWSRTRAARPAAINSSRLLCPTPSRETVAEYRSHVKRGERSKPQVAHHKPHQHQY
jgi:hypothetical protein